MCLPASFLAVNYFRVKKVDLCIEMLLSVLNVKLCLLPRDESSESRDCSAEGGRNVSKMAEQGVGF